MLTLGSRAFEEIFPGTEWPDPLQDVDGVKTFIGKDFARTRGWKQIHDNLNQTNMVVPMFYLDGGSPVFAKDIIRLDERLYWVNEFFEPWLGPVIWPLYQTHGAGYQDTGPLKQGTIDDGCNLHRVIGNPFWTRKGQYQKIEAIDYYSHPDPLKINYRLTPHLIHKNVVASKSSVEPVAYITHQKNGDGVWPNLFVNPLIHSVGNLEYFPALPFVTTYLGKPATITGLCFQASTVYGLFDDGWRIIEEMEISGIGSALYDRKVYVSDWLETPPPTIKGWTRGRTEKFDWQKV